MDYCDVMKWFEQVHQINQDDLIDSLDSFRSIRYENKNGNQIDIFQSSSDSLNKIIRIDSSSFIYPIDSIDLDAIKQWHSNPERRFEICKEVFRTLKNLKSPWMQRSEIVNDPSLNYHLHLEFLERIWNNLERKFLEDDDGFDQSSFDPQIIYYHVVFMRKFSILTIFKQLLIRLFLRGEPITIVSNGLNSISIEFLKQILLNEGVPRSVLKLMVNFEPIFGQKSSIIFLLTDTADVHSAILKACEMMRLNEIDCCRVFAQESHRNKIEEIITRYRRTFMLNDLDNLDEIFGLDIESTTIAINRKEDRDRDNRIETKNTSTKTIVSNQFGLKLNYFRSIDESISFISDLIDRQDEQNPRFLSIWIEETGEGIKIANQFVRKLRMISINCVDCVDDCMESIININQFDPHPHHRNLKWPSLEVIEHFRFRRFLNEYNLLPNKDLDLHQPQNNSWRLSKNRAQRLIKILDNDFLSKWSLTLSSPTTSTLIRMFLDKCHCRERNFIEDLETNRLRLNYLEPFGNVIILLANDTRDDRKLSSTSSFNGDQQQKQEQQQFYLIFFILELLTLGNTVWLIDHVEDGSSSSPSSTSQSNGWKQLAERLDLFAETSNIIKTFKSNRSKANTFSNGIALLLDNDDDVGGGDGDGEGDGDGVGKNHRNDRHRKNQWLRKRSILIDQNYFGLFREKNLAQNFLENLLKQCCLEQHSTTISLALQDYRMKNLIE